MLIAQIQEGIDAATKITSGRADSTILVLVMIAFAGFVLWQNARSVSERDKAADARNAEREKIDAERDKREAERWQLQREEDRKVTERQAVSLEVVAKGITQAGEASAIMAACSKKTENVLETFLVSQQRDRDAINFVIEFADAYLREEKEEARQSLRRARTALTGGNVQHV